MSSVFGNIHFAFCISLLAALYFAFGWQKSLWLPYCVALWEHKMTSFPVSIISVYPQVRLSGVLCLTSGMFHRHGDERERRAVADDRQPTTVATTSLDDDNVPSQNPKAESAGTLHACRPLPEESRSPIVPRAAGTNRSRNPCLGFPFSSAHTFTLPRMQCRTSKRTATCKACFEPASCSMLRKAHRHLAVPPASTLELSPREMPRE